MNEINFGYEQFLNIEPEDATWSKKRIQQLYSDLTKQYPNIALTDQYLEADHTIIIPYMNEDRAVLVLKTDYSFDVMDFPPEARVANIGDN